MSLCGFDKDIYALPAFMGLGHCGDAYLDLPPPLSRQAGREADIINSSLSSYPTSPTLSPPSCRVVWDQALIDWWPCDLSHTVTDKAFTMNW